MAKDIRIPDRFELWSLDRLRPYEKNARTHSSDQVNKIAASILEFGFANPVLVDGQDGIIAGHGRLLAARQLGMKQVPVVVLDHLTDVQRRAYVLADNRLALDAGWDEEILAGELQALSELDFKMNLTGFTDDELKGYMEIGEGSGLGGSEGGAHGDDPYTKKIKAPIYTPKGEMPAVGSLCDQTKTNQLMEKIEAGGIPEDVKEFLRKAAQRHSVFNYESIAEYYSHASKEVQELMEDSALVIIDFDKAIEGGFVRMTKKIAEAYAHVGE